MIGKPVADGRELYMWESSSLNHGSQYNHHAIMMLRSCFNRMHGSVCKAAEVYRPPDRVGEVHRDRHAVLTGRGCLTRLGWARHAGRLSAVY